MFNIFLTGLISSFVQASCIGMQNIFVLQSGIKKNHIFVVTTVCALCDIFLISLSVFGITDFIVQQPILMRLLQFAGAGFLFYYGYKLLNKSHIKDNELNLDSKLKLNAKRSAIYAMSVSLLNPHAIVDTVLIIGSLATEYLIKSERVIFYLGTICASVIWFYCLGYSASLMAKFFAKASNWKVLDKVMGFVMLALGVKLIF